MLSGCPDCGGNTFQFRPASALAEDEPNDPTSDATAPDPSVAASETGSPSTVDRTEGRTPNRTVTEADDSIEPVADDHPPARSRRPGPIGRARAAVRDWVRIDSSPDPRPVDPDDTDNGSTGNEGRSKTDGNETEPGLPSVRSPDDGREDVADADPAPMGDAGTGADESTPPPSAADGRIAAEPDEDQPDLDDLRRELNEQFESIRIVEPGQYELNLMELYDRDEYIIALRENGRYVIEAPESWLGHRADRD
jgi:uncharacterized protein